MPKNKNILIAILILFFVWTIYGNYGYRLHSDDIWATKGFKRIKKVGSDITGTDFEKYRFPEFCRTSMVQKENKGHRISNCINNMKLMSLNWYLIKGLYRGVSDSKQTVCEMDLNALKDGSYMGCNITFVDASVADSIELGEAYMYALRKKDPKTAEYEITVMKKMQDEMRQRWREKETKKAFKNSTRNK